MGNKHHHKMIDNKQKISSSRNTGRIAAVSKKNVISFHLHNESKPPITDMVRLFTPRQKPAQLKSMIAHASNHMKQNVSSIKMRATHRPGSETPMLLNERAANNKTGMPDQLKSGLENLSGISMDHVKVHYNSPKPAQLHAHAYTQGSDIHVAPGQEKHLPHEGWHVVQQAQGRVRPTFQLRGQMAGTQINDDTTLEREADVMGAKAAAKKSSNPFSDSNTPQKPTRRAAHITNPALQGAFSQTARDNFQTARDILDTAMVRYNAFDGQLDGNRGNWGFSQSTWNLLRDNVELKSNHIRGQGVADALESLSWKVNNNPRTVRGPGGAAGIDLRLFSTAGVVGARMDIEVKHANTNATLRDQINSAVAAHGRNQTIKLYKNPNVAVPNINFAFARAPRNYTFRGLGYAGNDDSATVEFYDDTNPTVRVQSRIVSWH